MTANLIAKWFIIYFSDTNSAKYLPIKPKEQSNIVKVTIE